MNHHKLEAWDWFLIAGIVFAFLAFSDAQCHVRVSIGEPAPVVSR